MHMKSISFFLICISALGLLSCKTYDYNDYKLSLNLEEKVLDKSICPLIPTEENAKVYQTFTTETNMTGHESTKMNKNPGLAATSDIIIKSYIHELGTDTTKDYGYLKIKLINYDKKDAGIGWKIASFTAVPLLFGAPYGRNITTLNATADIYDATNRLLITYDLKGVGKSYVGGIGCYKPADIDAVSNVKAINDILSQLRAKIEVDSKKLNGRLVSMGENKAE